MSSTTKPSITGVSHVDLSVTDLAASDAWYRDLLDMVPLFGGRNDDRGYDVRYLIEPTSGLVIGLEQHDANPGTPFDERRVGLDHLSFNVADRATLDD
jgi:catechol 2,3-dioxygenase-like lactoylglutathione lyase family enzyme